MLIGEQSFLDSLRIIEPVHPKDYLLCAQLLSDFTYTFQVGGADANLLPFRKIDTNGEMPHLDVSLPNLDEESLSINGKIEHLLYGIEKVFRVESELKTDQITSQKTGQNFPGMRFKT